MREINQLLLGSDSLSTEQQARLGDLLNTLTSLDLEENNLKDAGAESLAEALQDNHTLTTLYLGDNDLNAAGAEFLAKALQDNRTLTTHDLEGNDIKGAGAQHCANLEKCLQRNHTYVLQRAAQILFAKLTKDRSAPFARLPIEIISLILSKCSVQYSSSNIGVLVSSLENIHEQRDNPGLFFNNTQPTQIPNRHKAQRSKNHDLNWINILFNDLGTYSALSTIAATIATLATTGAFSISLLPLIDVGALISISCFILAYQYQTTPQHSKTELSFADTTPTMVAS